MLVTVTGFGSVWRWRLRKAPGHPQCLAESAYYNTTGVEISGSIRQRSKIVGYVRFNGRGGFDPNHPSRIINRVFECADPCVWLGQNKLLFKRMLTAPQKPDLFLVVVRPERTGVLRVGGANWRSEDSWLIAFSEYRDQQEAISHVVDACVRLDTNRVRQIRAGTGDWPPWVGRLVLACGE